jgi:hypothetical protein
MIFPKTPPLRFTHAKNWHIQYLAERLRPDEMAEYAAFFDGEDFDADLVARGFMNLPGDKFCVFGQDGQPAVVGGGYKVRGGVYKLWMIGSTLGWSTEWKAITRAAAWFVGHLSKVATRIEVCTTADRTRACQWYERALGMHREATLMRAGSRGENLVIYAKLGGA